jgi:ribonuclease R
MSDRVRVQVSRVDLDARKIDFRLVRDTLAKPPVPRASAGAADHAASAGNGAAGPRIRTFGDDEMPSTRARGGTKKGSTANPTRGPAKKRSGAASKSASSGRPARKKR